MDSIIPRFEKMGARVKVTQTARQVAFWFNRGMRPAAPVTIDIQRDRKGEFFDVRYRPDVTVEVIDVRPADRHLLLMVREPKGPRQVTKSKFLCGHDERAWFVAAVPESSSASNVPTAKEALKPEVVRREQSRKHIKSKDLGKRHTDAYIRQGEWFFLPLPQMVVDSRLILRNEPISRGRGKPHRCEFVYRTGGQTVWVNRKYPNGLTPAQYAALPSDQREASGWRWMVRDPSVFARGAIRHADHKTIILPCWHLVQMNTETQSRAMRNVAFLD